MGAILSCPVRPRQPGDKNLTTQAMPIRDSCPWTKQRHQSVELGVLDNREGRVRGNHETGNLTVYRVLLLHISLHHRKEKLPVLKRTRRDWLSLLRGPFRLLSFEFCLGISLDIFSAKLATSCQVSQQVVQLSHKDSVATPAPRLPTRFVCNMVKVVPGGVLA